MSNQGDKVERTTVTETPVGAETVREYAPVTVRSGNTAGWWIAAIVAIVAVVGLVFLFNNQTSQSDLQAARDQGAAEATLAAATADAQLAANQASQAAQSAVGATAEATQHAAEAAQSAADQTAQSARSAGDAAQDAVTIEPAPPQQ